MKNNLIYFDLHDESGERNEEDDDLWGDLNLKSNKKEDGTT